MKDEYKLKAPLIKELAVLGQQVAELEASESDCQRAEEALPAAKDYAESLINNSMDMIISVDANRRIVEFNRAAEQTFGYSKEEVLGKAVDLLYADPSESLRVAKSVLQEGRFTGEVTNKRRDGERFYSYISTSVIRDAHDKVVRVMGISRDITEHKRAEEALRESEKHYRQLFENTNDGIFILSRDGHFVAVNPKFAELSGMPREKMIGKTTEIFLPGGFA